MNARAQFARVVRVFEWNTCSRFFVCRTSAAIMMKFSLRRQAFLLALLQLGFSIGMSLKTDTFFSTRSLYAHSYALSLAAAIQHNIFTMCNIENSSNCNITILIYHLVFLFIYGRRSTIRRNGNSKLFLNKLITLFVELFAVFSACKIFEVFLPFSAL